MEQCCQVEISNDGRIISQITVDQNKFVHFTLLYTGCLLIVVVKNFNSCYKNCGVLQKYRFLIFSFTIVLFLSFDISDTFHVVLKDNLAGQSRDHCQKFQENLHCNLQENVCF